MTCSGEKIFPKFVVHELKSIRKRETTSPCNISFMSLSHVPVTCPLVWTVHDFASATCPFVSQYLTKKIFHFHCASFENKTLRPRNWADLVLCFLDQDWLVQGQSDAADSWKHTETGHLHCSTAGEKGTGTDVELTTEIPGYRVYRKSQGWHPGTTAIGSVGATAGSRNRRSQGWNNTAIAKRRAHTPPGTATSPPWTDANTQSIIRHYNSKSLIFG